MPVDNDAAKAASPGGSRGPRVALRVMVVVALVFGLLAVGQVLRSRGERATTEPAAPRQASTLRPGTPRPPAPGAQNGSVSEVKVAPENVLPGVICGILDGGKLTEGGVFLWGWAYDPRNQTPAAAVILLDNGRQLSPPVRVFRERPDVAAFKKSPQLVTSGWNVLLPASQLTGDEHVFEAFAILNDQKLGRLGGKISIGSKKDRGAGSS